MIKLMPIFGTRPEAIKMAPIILEAKKRPHIFDVKVCVTGQHKEMLDQMLAIFDITPDYDLNLMVPNQTLSGISSKTISSVAEILSRDCPDWVLVQGDTTTVWAAAISACFEKIRIGHIEAGLRSGDKHQPFPEEINRRIATQIADLHFAPTYVSEQNLLKDGISKNAILVTGNTVIDSLYWVLKQNKKHPDPQVEKIQQWKEQNIGKKRFVLVTGHRRENFGRGFEGICKAVSELAEKYKDVCWVYPVHLNPNVQEPVNRTLANIDNVFLIEPLGYTAFAWLMNESLFLLTDSGGIQEEAPSLGKRVLVMRNTTERPEGVESGVVKLVGTQPKSIVENCERLLSGVESPTALESPYGDGKASMRILNAIIDEQQKITESVEMSS